MAARRRGVRTVTDIDVLADRLRAAGDPAKKEWWERYLKGVIEFHGVPMGTIRHIAHDWAGSDPPLSPIREAAWALLERPVAEEKLAAILLLQEILLPARALRPGPDLTTIARLFDDGHIWDWNTTDWLCVRVLGPLIEIEGLPVAETIVSWVGAPSIWRRRASMVAFVPLVSGGDASFPGMVDLVLGACDANAADRERFIQTGIGWVLRELSATAPQRVFAFLEHNLQTMSREAVRMAAARLEDDHRRTLGITGKRRRR